MHILSIIEKKKKNKELTYDEIFFAVNGYVKGTIPDYQMSAFLMSVRLCGMNEEETYNLTKVMVESGETFDLTEVDGITVDKHSTGGVSDSTTFIVVPTLAELGLKVAKMSGRALAHTGGTIDKLESFGNLRTDLTREQFLEQIKRIGCGVMSANLDICPADKKIYALRDVTGTVDSLPLIAASIVSKKIASGASVIVFDVKFGDGAFMSTCEEACALARLMINLVERFGRVAGAVVTNMNQPLGNSIGAGEVLESMNVLRGNNFDSDLFLVSSCLIQRCATLAGLEVNENDIKEIMSSNRAYKRLKMMIESQGGKMIDEICQEERKIAEEIPKKNNCVYAKKNGTVVRIHTQELGQLVALAGGGRTKIGESVDHSVGIDLCVRLGSSVKVGDALALFCGDKLESTAIENCFEIDSKNVSTQLEKNGRLIECKM